MTSSPAPTPAAISARCSALVPVLTAMPWDAPDGRGDVRFDGEVLGFQVDERNHAAHLLEENSMRRPDARIDSVAASSMRTTRTPECPSAIGVRLLAMQSTK